MSDIIIPKKNVSSFLIGVFSTLVVLLAIGGVTAASVFNAGGGTIDNLGTPTADDQAATKAYVDAAGSRPTWEGFTLSTHSGDHGGGFGDGGFNDECHDDYPGSYACTYDDYIKLGNDANFSEDAWVIDGTGWYIYRSESTDYIMFSKDGRDNVVDFGPNCQGWNQGTTAYSGFVMDTAGRLDRESCNLNNRIPCCS